MAPIFSKPLKDTDISTRLTVPTTALQHFQFPQGSNLVNLLAEDSTGQEWTFRCHIRKKGHPKPVFTAGTWRPFVQAKRLKVEDEVIFRAREEGGDGAEYRIEATRYAFRLFGHSIRASVEQFE